MFMQQHDTEHKRPRRLNGIVLIALIVLGLVIVNYRPFVAAVHCTEETLETNPEVIMLSTRWCPYCYQARRYFSAKEISYCEYDIERSSEGERMFNEANGRVVPVIIAGKHMMSGFDEARFEILLNRVRNPQPEDEL